MKRDEYEGQLSVDVTFMLSTATKHSEEMGSCKVGAITPYESLVMMSGNITNHVTVQCLTEEKWHLYGSRIFYLRFFSYLFFILFWTIFYAIPPDNMSDWSGREPFGYFMMVFGILLLTPSFANIIFILKRGKARGNNLVNMAMARMNFEMSTSNYLTARYNEAITKLNTKVSTMFKRKLTQRPMNLVLIFIHIVLLVQCIVKGQRIVAGKELENKAAYAGEI